MSRFLCLSLFLFLENIEEYLVFQAPKCLELLYSRSFSLSKVLLYFVVAELSNKDPPALLITEYLLQDSSETRLEHPGSGPFNPNYILLLHICTLELFVLL